MWTLEAATLLRLSSGAAFLTRVASGTALMLLVMTLYFREDSWKVVALHSHCLSDRRFSSFLTPSAMVAATETQIIFVNGLVKNLLHILTLISSADFDLISRKCRRF